MIPFLIRLCIVCCGMIIVGVMSGLHGMPFFGVMLFGCMWLCYRSFDVIAWWLIFFCISVVIFFEQSAWLYAIIGLSGFYLFDFIHAYLVRNNNASKLVLFLVMLLISISVISIVHISTTASVRIDTLFDVASIIGVPVIFFVGAVCISYAEFIVGLYVNNDQRCHT